MLIPIRCFTCGNVIANKYGEYSSRIKAGEDPAEVMDSLNIKRVLLQENVCLIC